MSPPALLALLQPYLLPPRLPVEKNFSCEVRALPETCTRISLYLSLNFRCFNRIYSSSINFKGSSYTIVWSSFFPSSACRVPMPTHERLPLSYRKPGDFEHRIPHPTILPSPVLSDPKNNEWSPSIARTEVCCFPIGLMYGSQVGRPIFRLRGRKFLKFLQLNGVSG